MTKKSKKKPQGKTPLPAQEEKKQPRRYFHVEVYGHRYTIYIESLKGEKQ